MNPCVLKYPKSVKIPKERIKELFRKLNEVEFSQKGNFDTIGIIMW